MAPFSHVLTAVQGAGGGGVGMEMGHVPMGQQWLWEGGQAEGLIPVCVRMFVTAARVQA